MKHVLCTLAVAILIIGCSPGDGPIEIEEVRETESAEAPEVSTAERLGFRPTTPKAAPALQEFSWDTPEGWTEAAPTQFRKINMTIDGGAECYVSTAGGGVAANINRWRGQISNDPLSEAEVEALPKKKLLGEDALFLDVEGDYRGMGTAAMPDYRMLGLVLPQAGGQAVFVKMTGPKDVIGAQLDNFDAFCASIERGGAATASADPHAGVPGMGGADGDPHAGVPGMDSSGGDPHANVPGMAMTNSSKPDLHYSAPQGWEEVPSSSSMRLVTYKIGNSECYVSTLGGTGGGVAGNVNMWRASMGQGEASADELAALETIDIAGGKATYVEISGDYQGKSGESGENQLFLGAILSQPSHSIFVKMVGPQAEVAAQKANFRAFCSSIHSGEGDSH